MNISQDSMAKFPHLLCPCCPSASSRSSRWLPLRRLRGGSSRLRTFERATEIDAERKQITSAQWNPSGSKWAKFPPVFTSSIVWIFWMGKIIKSVECHVFKRTLIRSLSEAMTPRQFKIMRKSDRATPSSSRYPCTSPRAFLTTTGSYSTKKRNPSSCRPFHEVVFEVEQHLSNGTTFTIGKAKNMPFHKRIKNAKELNIWSIPPSESSLIPPLQPSPHAELPRNA